MNSVRIGMTHQEVENLIGKPTFVTTHDTASGSMEICDYTFDALNSANSAKSLIYGNTNGNEDLSMVVVYNKGVVLFVKSHNDSGSINSQFASQLDSHAGNKPLPEPYRDEAAKTPPVTNSESRHANTKPTAGVHVNKDMVVTEILVDSPAYNAGLKVNDVIIAFDGIPVNDTATLKQLTESVKYGDKKRLRVKRGDTIVDLSLFY
jgi:hypothetical protein